MDTKSKKKKKSSKGIEDLFAAMEEGGGAGAGLSLNMRVLGWADNGISGCVWLNPPVINI